MKKNNIKLLISMVFLMLIFALFCPAKESLAKNGFNKAVSLNSLSKKAKQETIHTRKALIKSFTKHITNLDTKFSYKISKKALKNFGKDFDRLWDEFTDNPSYNEIFKYSTISYDYYSEGGFLYMDVSAKYKISKNKAKKLLKKLDKKIITNRSELARRYTSHILKFDKKFKFNISKKLLAYSYDDIDAFREELTANPIYNDIMEYCDLKEDFYEYKNYWEWIITPNLSISKAEAEKISDNVTPMLTTRDEILEKMTEHLNNLDKTFSLNIKNETINLHDETEYDELWKQLYDIPKFYDINKYENFFSSSLHDYKGYTKWKIEYDYDLTKEEVDNLNHFVKTWVQTNIIPTMTEEEKVRAINDFMVGEYRYTFGDKGEIPEGFPDYGEEKIGKYSVYTSFSLLYEKGGVCNAKANMFYHLAKEAGLEVIYISGTGNGEEHAWNMVKVDGKWYHLDNTWNRSHYEGDSEDQYFNSRDHYLKSDNTMSKDHEWNRTKYPAAYEDYPLYNIPTSRKDNSPSYLTNAA